MSLQGPTKDHGEILEWAVRHGATPMEIAPYLFDGEPAVLRFGFGGTPGHVPEMRAITWESFFAHFDLMGLSMVYEDWPNGQAHIVYEFLQTESEDPYRNRPHLD